MQPLRDVASHWPSDRSSHPPDEARLPHVFGTELLDTGVDRGHIATAEREIPQVAEELGGLLVPLGQLRRHVGVHLGPRLRLRR